MPLKADKVPRWFNRARELALAEWQKRFDFERNEVFLTNPATARKVEKFVTRIVLPAARKALKRTRFRLSGDGAGQSIRRPADEIGNSVKLCIEDSKCSNRERSWFTRLEVNCQVHGASLLTDYLCIYLPLTTDFNLIVDILSETFDAGFPAELSVGQDHRRKQVFQIAFEHSAGPETGEYGHLPIFEKIEKKLLAHCDFIEIACEIEQNPKEILLFRRLIHQVNEVFDI